MPPIASVPVTFAPATTTPSVALTPDAAGQSASTLSQYLAGTGGAVFAAVSIVSVAGYLYHGRGTANKPGKSSAWATLSSFLSTMRRRGSGTTTVMTGSGWPPDVEGGLEHASVVYARCFHPTFWNLVECHPATPSAPAIYVEDEADEVPASPEPTPYGMDSFSDTDGSDRDRTATADNGVKPRVPYDARTATHVRFKSIIIGATDRPGGAFLYIPGMYPEGSPDTSSCDDASETPSSEADAYCSPYDGILAEAEVDLTCSSRDGTSTRAHDGIFETLTDSGADSELAYLNDSQEYACSAHGGIQTTPTRLYSGTRRYGMADMADLAQSLKYTIPRDSGLGLVRAMGCQSGLCDLADSDDTDSEADSAASYGHLEPVDDKPTGSSCDIPVHGSCDDFRKGWSDGDTFAPPYDGPDLMRRILEELRDPDIDCAPRDFSEDSDFEYEDGIVDDDEGPMPAWYLDRQGRISLEWTSSSPRTDSDVSDAGLIYPLTPPWRTIALVPSPPHVYKARMSPPATFWFDEEMQAVPACSVSPLWLPSMPYVRTHRPTRALPMDRGPT